jgi:hypothetical protein
MTEGDHAVLPTRSTIASPRPDRASATWTSVALDCVFASLLIFNAVRALRHPMWRDEFQPWQRALDSNQSLWGLIQSTKLDGHPSLWYAAAWLVTRFTDNPVWFQVFHLGLAIATWIIIYRWSPFDRVEKLLLLLSYFLFFEYFVTTRSYTLAALLGFVFVVVRQFRPQDELSPWLLLGLLANTIAYGTIWSISLAVVTVLQRKSFSSKFLAGAAFYAACLAFAAFTMANNPYDPAGYNLQGILSRFCTLLVIPIDAFVPFRPEWMLEALRYLGGVHGAPLPHYWDPSSYPEVAAFAHADADHPLRCAIVLAAPVVVCWMVVRSPLRVLEFTMTYVGILLFADIWDFVGGVRHHGFLFLAFIAAAWQARAEHPADVWSKWTLRLLLIVSACGGVATLTSELRPFSQGHAAAIWIERNGLASANLIGLQTSQTASISGYLRRPIYDLACECLTTHTGWPRPKGSDDPFGSRLLRAIDFGAAQEAILLVAHPLTAEEKAAAPNVSFLLLAGFDDASTKENVWIYHMSKTQSPVH